MTQGRNSYGQQVTDLECPLSGVCLPEVRPRGG
jgi:hypothetical protein